MPSEILLCCCNILPWNVLHGTYGASQVPVHLSSYMPRSITPVDSPHLALSGASVLTSTTLNVSSSTYRNYGAECASGVTGLLMACMIPCLHFMCLVRCLFPCLVCLEVAPVALPFSCACFERTDGHLLLTRKTRYRWVANPYRIWTSYKPPCS